MRTTKNTICLGIAVTILSPIILITSCTSEMETVSTTQTQTQNTTKTTHTEPVTGESLFQDGQDQEHLANYSDAIQLYEQVIAEFPDSSLEHYNLILQGYPSSQYAAMLKKLTVDDTEIEMIAGVEFDIGSQFTGTVLNESSYYIVELVIYVQLYQDINQVYYKNIAVNGINPGEEKSFEVSPWVPLDGWGSLIWSFAEVWLRVI